MAEFPYMPLYVAQFLADTNDMTSEEVGVYIRILATMWEHGGCIRYDMASLKEIAHARSSRRWERTISQVLSRMTIVDGMLTQKRLSDVFLRARETRKQRATAGRRGALTRWKPKIVS